MRIGSIAARAALFGILAGIVAACSQPPDVVIPCPAIRIPFDTERLTRFREGTGRDITDVVLQAEVKFLSGECSVQEDEIEMSFPIAVQGIRGPAEADGREDLTVFLAVSTRDREILTRRELPMSLRFGGNRTSIVAADVVTIQIPKRADQHPTEFVLFLGLALSEEELAFNREESGR